MTNNVKTRTNVMFRRKKISGMSLILFLILMMGVLLAIKSVMTVKILTQKIWRVSYQRIKIDYAVISGVQYAKLYFESLPNHETTALKVPIPIEARIWVWKDTNYIYATAKSLNLNEQKRVKAS